MCYNFIGKDKHKVNTVESYQGLCLWSSVYQLPILHMNMVFCTRVGSCGEVTGNNDEVWPCSVTLARHGRSLDASCYLICDTPRLETRLATGINHYWNKECPLTVIVINTSRPWLAHYLGYCGHHDTTSQRTLLTTYLSTQTRMFSSIIVFLLFIIMMFAKTSENQEVTPYD